MQEGYYYLRGNMNVLVNQFHLFMGYSIGSHLLIDITVCSFTYTTIATLHLRKLIANILILTL